MIYTFPPLLCSQLDEVAEAQLRDDNDAASGASNCETSSSSEDEQQQGAPSAAVDAREVRRTVRRAALDERHQAAQAELRQRSMQELLETREAARPDRAPSTRPRRLQARGWNRNEAWARLEAERQQS